MSDAVTGDDLVFYTNPMSRGRIVRWMLEEVGVPYRTEVMGYGGGMKDPAYLAINPMGKVPAIVHRGVVVTECAAICAYLADVFPQAGLVPSAPAAKAAYYRWMFFGAGPVESAITNASLGFVVPPEKAGMCGYGSLGLVVDVLEQAAAHASPWLLGEQFSAADVSLGSQINFGLMFGSLEKRPAFVEYSARLLDRPAAIRASGLDDAAIAAAK